MKNITQKMQHTPWIADALKKTVSHVVFTAIIALLAQKTGLYNVTGYHITSAMLGGALAHITHSWSNKDALLEEALLKSSPEDLKKIVDAHNAESVVELKIRSNAVIFSGPVYTKNGECLSFIMDTKDVKKNKI